LIECQRLLEQRNRIRTVLTRRRLQPYRAAAQNVIARVGALARPGCCGVDELEVERNRDPVGNLVLPGEQIAGVAVEPLCPQMHVAFGIDQLGGDADPGSRPLDLSFECIAHSQFAADLLDVDRLVPIGEGGIARDHQHVRDS